MIVPTQVDASRGGRTVLVPGQIVGMPLRAAAARRHARAGGRQGPAPGDARAQRRGARPRLRRALRPPGRRAVRLAGLGPVALRGPGAVAAVLPRVRPPGSFGGEATFAVVYAPLRVAQRAAGRARAGERGCVLRLAPGADVRARGARRASCPRPRAPGVGTDGHPRNRGARLPRALQGRAQRPAHPRRVRLPGAGRRGAGRVQPHQPRGRVRAPRDRRRHGAGRAAARAGPAPRAHGRPDRAARRRARHRDRESRSRGGSATCSASSSRCRATRPPSAATSS